MRERLEESERFDSSQVLSLVGRALRYVEPFRFRFGVKLGFLLLSFIPLLFLPWPTRILIDHVIRGVPLEDAVSPFPFFVQPFIDAARDLSSTELLIWTLLAQFVLLVLIGAFGLDLRERDRADHRGISQGWDTATRTENEANSGFSEIGGLLGLIDYRWTMRLTQALNHHYRTQLFDRIQSLPMTSLDDERIGDAVYRVMYDTTVITSTCYKLILTPIGAPIHIAMTVWVMGLVYGWQSPLIWSGLGFIGVAFIPTLPFAGLHRRFAGRSRKAGATTTSSIEESMHNVLAVQSLGGEARERRRFGADSADSFRQFRRLILVDMLTFSAAAIFGVLLVVHVLLYIGDGIIDGRLSAGDFAVLLSFFAGIAISSVNLGGIWIRLQNEATGLNRVFFLMDATSERDIDGSRDLPSIERSIEVQDVSFSYEPDTPTLRGVSFEARVGEVIAFAGPAGAGKSTLAYLIPRFIEPLSGRVLADGQDIGHASLTSLRKQIAFVFQETILFDATIAENIRLGDPDADDEEIRRAAQIAGAADFIEALPEGYETRLGRSGGKLSVGQKQRLSIARALVRRAPILILDEPTSALDPDTERRLVDALREASRTRIVIVIAHRLSTIRAADRILFLDDGAIVERGSHRELMARSEGAYRHYVELQTGDAA